MTTDPLHPHRHDPNSEPPSDAPTFTLVRPGGGSTLITPADLRRLPRTRVPDCYIVSTGHGTSGPFVFGGVRLLDLVEAYVDEAMAWSAVEVRSGDGFGNRVRAEELRRPDPAGPILLSDEVDGEPMTRREGLVRLIVPSERDDALRQVKWVATVHVVGSNE